MMYNQSPDHLHFHWPFAKAQLLESAYNQLFGPNFLPSSFLFGDEKQKIEI